MGAHGKTGRLLRIFAAPLLLGGVLTGLGSTAASAATAPACQAWTGGQPLNPNDTGSGDSLSGVDMLSACNVWVAGASAAGTLIEHWTGGSTWTVVPSPSPGAGHNFLTGINGISPNDIWAVGTDSNADGSAEQGLILHWNGISWLQTPSPNPGTFTQLTAVHEISARDAWAVGFFANGTADQTLIMHWDGTSWTQVPSPDPFEDDNLSGVAASSAGSAVAVGTGQTAAKGGKNVTLALRWDGKAWTQAPSIQVSDGDFLAGVTSISATEAWAVGFSGPTPTKTLAFHFK
jgi:hypothetical protein